MRTKAGRRTLVLAAGRRRRLVGARGRPGRFDVRHPGVRPGSVAIAGTVEPGASSTSPRPRVLIGTSASARWWRWTTTRGFRRRRFASTTPPSRPIRVADGFVATASADGFLARVGAGLFGFLPRGGARQPPRGVLRLERAARRLRRHPGGLGSGSTRARASTAVRVRGAAAEGGEEESSSVALLGDTTSAAHRTHRSPRVAADPTPGSREFALAAFGGTARVLRADTGEVTKEFAAPGERVTSLERGEPRPPGGSDSPRRVHLPRDPVHPPVGGSRSGTRRARFASSTSTPRRSSPSAFFSGARGTRFFPADRVAFAADGASLFAAGADASVCVFRCDETLFGDERVVPAKTLALAPARPNARTKYPRASAGRAPTGVPGSARVSRPLLGTASSSSTRPP